MAKKQAKKKVKPKSRARAKPKANRNQKPIGRTVIIRHAKKRAYLKSLEQSGAITISADAVGINRTTPQAWRATDPDFAIAEQTALNSFADRLEEEAVRRAIEGVRKKKFTAKGDPVFDPETGDQYVEREFSDTLLIFMLKGARPDKYKDRLDVRVSKEEAEIDARFTKLVETLTARAKEGMAGEDGTGSLRIETVVPATSSPAGLLESDV